LSTPEGRRTAYERNLDENHQNPQWRQMATGQNAHTPQRRRLGDRTRTGTAPPSGSDPAPVNPHENTPGHPDARGTLPMARYLLDPAVEDEIQALAREAPPMTEDQRARLVRLLRLNRPRGNRAA
jgi:hypothetical protein